MERKDSSNILDGINNNTYNLIFSDNYNGPRLVSNDEEFLLCAIEEFTKLDDQEIEYVLNHNTIFKRVKNGFVVERNSKKYSFAILDTYFDDVYKEELRSDRRRTKCVSTSISLAHNFDRDCKVVFGYLDSEHDRIMHAVFVDCSQEKEIVYDYTKNLVVTMDDYIEMAKYQIINEISGDDIKRDYKYLRQIEHLSSKFYLCFRDEMMRDLKKNKKVFKMED